MLMKKVYQQGLNIYSIVNYLKRLRGNEIPDSVIEILCNEYLKQKIRIRNPFPWAVKVLRLKADELNARVEIDKAEEYKKQVNVGLLKNLFR